VPTPPRRPVQDDSEEEVEDEDDDDPFADKNAMVTPHVERTEPRW
jgi:hypothetical protein